MIDHFSFLTGYPLAGSAHPGLGGSLRSNLLELARTHGLSAVVSLTPSPLPESALAECGLKGHHLPIDDFSVPTLEAMASGVAFALEAIRSGEKVLAHCAAGYGRTGTFLACCLVAMGLGAAEAVRRVRIDRPGSLETNEQVDFVHEWGRWIEKSGWKG